MKLLIVPLILILASCVTKPDLVSGEDCWRFHVLQNGNTGPMTIADIESIKVVRLTHGKLLRACGIEDERTLSEYWRDKRSMMIRGCFMPRPVNGLDGEDIIYLYKFAGRMELYEEQCHALLGREHNSCVGYGIGADESACNWNKG